MIEENIPYHLVLNPDIYFETGVIEELFEYMENNKNVGNVMPKVLYPDGKLQHLCKLLPTPKIWLGRFIATYTPFLPYFERENNKFEMKFADFNEIFEVPYLSGCFMFLRTETLKNQVYLMKIFFYIQKILICQEEYLKLLKIYIIQKFLFITNIIEKPIEVKRFCLCR